MLEFSRTSIRNPDFRPLPSFF